MTFAVFLDRDGTIVRDRHYVADSRYLELLPGAAQGLREMREMGARLIVVTNQSGVGRGFFTEDDLERQHRRVEELLSAAQVQLDGIYSCTHAPDDRCDCRKPAPGLVLRAARELGIDLASSYVVGDRPSDLELAQRVGALGIGIGERRLPPGALRCDDLPAAAAVIRGLRGTRS